MKRMFHQYVHNIKYDLKNEEITIPQFSKEQNTLIKSIGQFIYQNDNIYLTTNIRKLWNNFDQKLINFEQYLSILKELHQKGLLDIKFLEDPIYSSVIVSPYLMFIFYKHYLQEFEKVLQLIIFEIKEKETYDSFKISQNIGVKLVVVNNILDYMRIKGIANLMRYSGTPLPGGKSFIILNFDKQKLESFIKETISV